MIKNENERLDIAVLQSSNLSELASVLLSKDHFLRAKKLILAHTSTRHDWIHFGRMSNEIQLSLHELVGDKNSPEYQLNRLIASVLFVGFRYSLFVLDIPQEHRLLAVQILKGMPNHSFDTIKRLVINHVTKYIEQYINAAGGVF